MLVQPSVSDLSPFDIGSDSRTNLFEEGRNDENIGQTQSVEELLQMLIRPITRARAKKFQEALNGIMKKNSFGPTQHYNKSLGQVKPFEELEPTKNSKRS